MKPSPQWRKLSLAEVARCEAGGGFPHAFQGRLSEEIPFFKVSDMNAPGNSIFLRKAANTISSADISKLGAKLKPARSVIFPKVGGALLTNKKRLLPQPSLIDNNMMAVWPLPDSDLLHIFLYFWFLSIDLADLANMGPLPSINEMKSVV